MKYISVKNTKCPIWLRNVLAFLGVDWAVKEQLLELAVNDRKIQKLILTEYCRNKK